MGLKHFNYTFFKIPKSSVLWHNLIMKNKLVDFGLGLVAGIMSCGVLWLIFELFEYPKDFLFGLLLSVLFLPILEELTKYFPLKLSLFKENYVLIGFGIGLGFALMETFIRVYPSFSHLDWRFKPSLLHITTATLMGFSISKKKGWIGLLIAIALHCLYNFWIRV
jgi:RsiW-degrading membrane proteinase PrsW (M82 family)